jgi:peptidoglycan/xylan/chitin deacetylase (PgdA/CDA1 family)
MMTRSAILVVSAVLLGGCTGWPSGEPASAGGQSDTEASESQGETESPTARKPIGYVQLIEFHDDIQGLRNWAHELDQRGLTSLVNIQQGILEAYPEDVKWLADRGHEIMGGYPEGALWDVPYEEQLEGMRETKALLESVTDKPMRVFSSAYFAYDENTLRAADELGVEYVLARGTSDVEALIYEPDEYDCKIISVSNVTFADMGRGSLCDYSLYARGATAAEFEQVLEDTLDKYPKRVMVVSHAYLGGVKKDWWAPYEQLLDGGEVQWAASFDEWVTAQAGVNLKVPFSMVPDNREVKYTTPTPSTPLEELEDVDQMYNPCAAP